MAITDRNLSPGTRLAARYKGATYHLTVNKDSDKTLRFELEDGRIFSSLSAAGSAVMGGISCNGWRFWSHANDLGLPEATPLTRRESSPHRKTKKQPEILIRPLPNQDGVDESARHWWCSACLASFTHDDEGEPQQCPEGHPREAAEEAGQA